MASNKRKKAAYTEAHKEDANRASREQHAAFQLWQRDHAGAPSESPARTAVADRAPAAHKPDQAAHKGQLAHKPDPAAKPTPAKPAARRRSVREIMTPRVVAVTAVTFLPEAAQIMKDEDVGALPVVREDGQLMGILTDRDIAVRGVAGGRDITTIQVAEIFTAEDLVTISADADLQEAEALMAENQVRRLPIVGSNNQLVGMVTLSDVARKLGEDHAPHLFEEVVKPSNTHNQKNE